MARRPQQAVQLADPAQADQISAADELSEWQGDGQFMQSLARGLLVLREVVKGRGKVVPPREIAETTGLSIQSVRRCIYTMNATGHVRANRNGAVPGLALSELAGEFFASSPLVAACGPILDKLHDELGVTVSLATFESDEPTIIASCSTDSLLRVELPIGSVMPIHSTAIGKVYLASLSDIELEVRLRSAELPAYTARTITEPEALRKMVTAVRRSGYAVAEEELTEGLRGIAVPVISSGGIATAAITASVITSTSSKQDIREHIVPALQDAANRLSQYA